MNLFKFSTCILSIIMTSACSTIVSGTTQTMLVQTPYAPGAHCTLKDSRKGSWVIASTPGTKEVKKGNGPMHIRCTKPAHKVGNKTVKEGFAGATLGNVLVGGVIGIAVDAASGAAQEYPDSVLVWLEPKEFSSEKSKEMWHAEKAKYENPKNKQQRNTLKTTGNYN